MSVGPKNSSGSTQRYLNFLLATAHFYADNFEDAWVGAPSRTLHVLPRVPLPLPDSAAHSAAQHANPAPPPLHSSTSQAALQKTVDQCNMKKQMSTASTTGRVYEHFHLDVAALQVSIRVHDAVHVNAVCASVCVVCVSC